MLLQCAQEDVRQALVASTLLSKEDPFLPGVTLVAQSPRSGGGMGLLRVASWSARTAMGMWAEIPAVVALEGSMTLPFQPLTDLVALLRPGMVQLAQEIVSEANALAPFREGGVIAFTGDPVLCVEQESTSRRGTRSTRRARFQTIDPERVALVPQPTPAFGQARGLPVARVSVAEWRTALAPCLLLAKEHAAPSETTPEMHHELVLVRFEADRLCLTASTREELVGRPLHFLEALDPVPFAHALFAGDALAWISRCLTATKASGPLTLALVSDDESGQVDLQVATDRCTFVCCGTREAIPLVWEQRFALPTLVDLLVPHAPLTQALTLLATAKHDAAWNGHVVLQVQNQVLVLQWVTGSTEMRVVRGQQEIPLQTETPNVAPVWVNLRQCRQQLAWLQGPMVSLQLGTLRARNQESPSGFLRLSTPGDPTTMFLMTLSRIKPAASQPENASQKGVALAIV